MSGPSDNLWARRKPEQSVGLDELYMSETEDVAISAHHIPYLLALQVNLTDMDWPSLQMTGSFTAVAMSWPMNQNSSDLSKKMYPVKCLLPERIGVALGVELRGPYAKV